MPAPEGKNYDLPAYAGRGNVFVMPVCVCVSVCLSVCFGATTFEPVDIETSFFGMVLHLDHI